MTNEQIGDIVDNLDCGLRCFVHRGTKAIVTIPDTTNNPEIDSELWNDAIEEIENNFGSYVEIDKMGSNESFRLMQNFIETVENERLRDKLDQALNKSKPFRNFKFEIDNSGPYRQRWFDFERQRLMAWVKEQVTANDL